MDSYVEPMEVISWRSHSFALLALFPAAISQRSSALFCLSVSPVSFFGNLLSYPLLFESGLKEGNTLLLLLPNFTLERPVTKASVNRGGLELKCLSISHRY
jgi:hypothetical protein